jgi:hypothetical protein
MTQEQQNEIKLVLQTWGSETVRLMLTEFQKTIYFGRDKTQTNLYTQFNPNLVQDVSKIAWVLTLPEYAEKVDAGTKPGTSPTRGVIAQWAKARGLPSFGMNDMQFINFTRKLVYQRGIPRVDFFKYFTDNKENRIVELEKNLYITIGNILENDIIKITKKIK